MSPSTAATANPEHALQRLQKDPELIALSLAARRATLTTNYGPFFRGVGLTPAQVDRFQALLMAREEQRADLQATRVSGKMGENDSAFATLQKQIETENDRAQRELLGDAAYRRKFAARWKQLREKVFLEQNLQRMMDDNVRTLGDAVKRNAARWRTLSGPYPDRLSFEDDVAQMRDWTTARLKWLDAEIARRSGETR